MAIHRIIFRLDFDPAFDMLNRTGDIFSCMSQLHQSAGIESPINMNYDPGAIRITGQYQEERFAKTITVELGAITVDIQLVDGIAPSAVYGDKVFQLYAAIAQDICTMFRIDKFKRAGVRLFVYDTIFSDRARSISVFSSLVDAKFLERIEGALGGSADFAFVVEGDAKDGLSYRLVSGPFRDGEPSKLFAENFARFIDDEHDYDMALDLDISEKAFSYQPRELTKWFLSPLDKCELLLRDLKATLKAK